MSSSYRAVNTSLDYKNQPLIVYRQIITVCSEIYTQPGQNVESLSAEPGGTQIYHWDLNSVDLFTVIHRVDVCCVGDVSGLQDTLILKVVGVWGVLDTRSTIQPTATRPKKKTRKKKGH